MSGITYLLPAMLLSAPGTLRPMLLVITAGVLLIEIECLLPGRVVFGAGGLLLTLLGVHWLSLIALNGSALLLAGVGAALLFGSVLFPLRPISLTRWPARIVGTVLLAAGSATLESSPLHPTFSISGLTFGLLLGCCTSLLLHVAIRAHSNKHGPAQTRDGALDWHSYVPE